MTDKSNERLRSLLCMAMLTPHSRFVHGGEI